MSVSIHDILSEHEHEEILRTIGQSEKNTSGEIRLYIEACCKGEVLDRASLVFSKLDMHKTTARNGVLFYLAFEDKKFAIIGDAGINAVVKKDFWNEIKDMMASHFKKGEFFEGLNLGIREAGEALKAHFPYHSEDNNELSDDIIFGDEKI
jgi:uncharacterized membrane protein